MIRVHLISHTHWDREWYEPHEAFRFRLNHLFEVLLDCLKNDPKFTFFLDGQTAMLEDAMAVRPGLLTSLRPYFDSGQLEIGPWYIQADHYLVSRKSIEENLKLATRMCRDWGITPCQIAYIPDQFGHPACLPDIFNDFGMPVAFAKRGLAEDTPPVLRWKGSSGKEVILLYQSYDPLNVYPGSGWGARLPLSPKELAQGVEKYLLNLYGATEKIPADILIMFGTDHQFPWPDLGTLIKAANTLLAPHFELLASTWKRYLSVFKIPSDCPTVTGELRILHEERLLQGTHSSRSYLKVENDELMHFAEIQAAPLLQAVHADPPPAWINDALQYGWKLILQNQPHDSICGCSHDWVHQHMQLRSQKAQLWFQKLSAALLSNLAAPTASGSAAEVLLYHSGGIESSHLLTLYTPVGEFPSAIQDPTGQSLDFRLLDSESTTCLLTGPYHGTDEPECHKHLLVLDLYQPAVQQIQLKLHTAPKPLQPLAESMPLKLPWKKQLPWGGVRFDENGLLYLTRNTEWIGPIGFFEDQGDCGDTYNFCPTDDLPCIFDHLGTSSATYMELGKRHVIVTDQRLVLPDGLYPLDRRTRSEDLVTSVAESAYTVWEHAPFVPLELIINNQSKDHRLRWGCRPFKVQSIIARDVSGWIERPLRKPDDWRCTYTHPHSGWILLKGSNHECLAIYALGLREYELAEDGTFYLTLIRAVDWLSRADLSSRRYPAGPEVYVPAAQMPGPWKFRLAVGLQTRPEDCEAQFKRWAVAPLVYQNLENLVGLSASKKTTA